MTIRDLRTSSGLTQEQFAGKFHIPLQTLKQWESSPGSSSHRVPPAYVVYMLERLTSIDSEVNGEDETDHAADLVRAAKHSRYHARHWFRYLRKEIDIDGHMQLSPEEVEKLLSGNELTMFQKITLRRAMTYGSPTNVRIAALNKPAGTPMMNQLLALHKERNP